MSAVTQSLDRARSLPPATLTDPAWFAHEQATVFGRSWIAVARVDQLLNPGDYVTFQLAADPLVVVRDRAGVLRAFPNVCRHRSTMIVEGSGSVPALQCQNHLWTWSLDGRLVGAPDFAGGEGFEPQEWCLTSLRVETWQGWVLVNLDSNAAAFADSVNALTERLALFELDGLVTGASIRCDAPFNWKVLVENFSESYHHAGVHPESLQRTFPGNRSWADHNGGEPWLWLDHVSLDVRYPPFTANVVFPMLAFSVLRGIAVTLWFKVQPISVDRTMLDIVALVPPDFADDGAELLVGVAEINDEDVRINVRTQHGLRSRFASPGPVHELERGCWQFRQWLASMTS